MMQLTIRLSSNAATKISEGLQIRLFEKLVMIWSTRPAYIPDIVVFNPAITR